MPNTATSELATIDAVASAELVRSGEVSTLELVDAAIARIEAVDPQLNAVIHQRFDEARAEAKAVSLDAPLAGVPTLIKDVDLAGDPFFNGARVYAELNWRLKATDRLGAHDSGALLSRAS